ncbi:MAG: GyrI-like domain-containing protein [Candidatus Limnocylindrales bacterium]|jgi:hypothetical protein
MAVKTSPRADTASAAKVGSSSKPDLRKALSPLLNPPREPVLVDVPELGYLMIDGQGAPDEGADYPTTDFQKAFAALFPVVYTIKFGLKRDGVAMPILPLEALWYTSDDETFDMNVPPERWGWRALLAVSDDVTPAVFERAVAEVRRKKGDSDALGRMRFERWREGRCAQVMHVGPYSEERPTIERLHAFIAAQGCRPRGAHHEIYLGDPRRADPAKLKTVLRQPVE